GQAGQVRDEDAAEPSASAISSLAFTGCCPFSTFQIVAWVNGKPRVHIPRAPHRPLTGLPAPPNPLAPALGGFTMPAYPRHPRRKVDHARQQTGLRSAPGSPLSASYA